MPGSEAALNDYLIVGALLFTLGLVGFLARRNLIVMFLCAELMLQGVSEIIKRVAFLAGAGPDPLVKEGEHHGELVAD